jgi:hypothetical protein
VSYAPAPVNKYLVIWTHDPSDNGVSTDQRIDGRILNGDGTPFTNAFVADDRTSKADRLPDVAFDGTNWFVTYVTDGSTAGNTIIAGRFVSTAGVPGTVADPNATQGFLGAPRIAYTNNTYLIIWPSASVSPAKVYARTMTTTGTFPTSVTAVHPGELNNNQRNPDVCAGGGKFLISWSHPNPIQSPNRIMGRICNPSLVFDAAAFSINANAFQFQTSNKVCFSATNSEWFVAYEDTAQFVDIYGNRVSLSGVPGTNERLTFTNTEYFGHGIAWNSVRNTALLVYTDGEPEPPQLFGRRYTFAGVLPAPTGLTATPTNSGASLTWNAVTGAIAYAVYRSTGPGGPYTMVYANTLTNSFVDSGLENGRTYYYAVAAQNDLGVGTRSADVSVVPLAPSAYTVLFVVGTAPVPNPSGDFSVQSRLQSLGYTVQAKTAATAATADANGKSLVLISSTVTSGDVNTKFRDVAVPVLVWESAVLDDMKMTGTTSGTHFGTTSGQTAVKIVSQGHPMAAGLLNANHTTSASQPYTWGNISLSPGAQAQIVATLTGNTNQAVIFGYEKSAAMVGQNAPARRVGFFLGDATATSLTTNGWNLFDAAVRWAASSPAAPVGVTVQPWSGKITLSWAAVPGALSYTIRSSTSPTGPFTTLVATGVSGTEFTKTGLSNNVTLYYVVTAEGVAGSGPSSAAISGTPRANTAVVDIVGETPPGAGAIVLPAASVIRAVPNGGTPDATNRAKYTAVVKKSVNNVVQDLSVDGTTVSGIWNVISGGLQIINFTNTTVELQTSNAIGTGLVSYKATLSTGEETFTVINVKVDKRRRIALMFHFPADQPGRTTRTDPMGQDLWGPDDANNTRYNARHRVAVQLYDTFKETWKQAALDFYLLIENFSQPFETAGCDSSGRLIFSDDNNVTTNETLGKLWRDAFSGYIHVYLVNGLGYKNAAGTFFSVNGSCTPGGFEGLEHVIVCVKDPPGPDGVTFAHEIGHALGHLAHIGTGAGQVPLKAWSFHNNTIQTLGLVPAMDRLTMRTPLDGRIPGYYWVPDPDAQEAWVQSKAKGFLFSED